MCINPTQKDLKYYWEKLRKTKINGGICHVHELKDSKLWRCQLVANLYFDPHENPNKFCIETDRLLLKIILEMQQPKNSQGKQPQRGLINEIVRYQDLSIYVDSLTRIVWYWCMHRQREEWNEIENPHIYVSMIYDNV